MHACAGVWLICTQQDLRKISKKRMVSWILQGFISIYDEILSFFQTPTTILCFAFLCVWCTASVQAQCPNNGAVCPQSEPYLDVFVITDDNYRNVTTPTCPPYAGTDTGGGGYGGSSPPLPESGRVYSVRTRSVT